MSFNYFIHFFLFWNRKFKVSAMEFFFNAFRQTSIRVKMLECCWEEKIIWMSKKKKDFHGKLRKSLTCSLSRKKHKPLMRIWILLLQLSKSNRELSKFQCLLVLLYHHCHQWIVVPVMQWLYSLCLEKVFALLPNNI